MAQGYRAVLEVMKYLEPDSLLSNCCFVSKEWRNATDNHEVWSAVISDIYGDEDIVEKSLFSSGRAAYKWFQQTRSSIYTFNDGERFLDPVREEEAKKKGEEFHREPTYLLHVQLPSMEKHSTPLPEHYHHAFHASSVWLPPSHLFVTGGRYEDYPEDHSPTYLIFLHDITVKTLPNTQQINSPTLVYYNRYVYSFGGSVFPEECSQAVSQVTTRKFALNSLKWEETKSELPHPHCYGWGERYNSRIFIIGGFGSDGRIDEFDTISETFRTLNVQLPPGSTSKHEALFAIPKSDSLMCLTGQKTFTLSLHELATDSVAVKSEQQLSMDNIWMWTSPAVVVDNKAYFVVYDIVLFTLDLSSKKIEQSNLVEDANS